MSKDTTESPRDGFRLLSELFFPGSRILREAIRDRLAEPMLALTIEKITPSRSPGRGKRTQRSEFHESVFQIAALAAMGLDTDGWATDIISAAIREHDPEILRVVASAIEAVRDAPDSQTKFSRHVASALRHKRILKEACGSDPTKGEVKAAVIEEMAKAGKPSFSADETDRWREIFTAAGLKYLPQDRPGSTKARE